MNNRQVSISIRYGSTIYKKNFSEQDACSFINFLEEHKLWYEINEAIGGEQPTLLDEKLRKDDKNE